MIPARMGSKRVPKKNIRILNNKPLIQYPIDLALSCSIFDEIWINTESEELGKYAADQGIRFYMRPAELSSDASTNREFMFDFLMNHTCDYVVMINPTSPLLSLNTLESLLKMIQTDNYDTIMSTVPEKTECFYMEKPINFNTCEKINSQFIEPVYRTVWALTSWRRSVFLNNQLSGTNPIFGGRIGLFPIPKYEACDIDTEDDWIIATQSLSANISESPKYLKLDDWRRH
jgi:CMP-N-acetylneuraminic acid synthetase